MLLVVMVGVRLCLGHPQSGASWYGAGPPPLICGLGFMRPHLGSSLGGFPGLRICWGWMHLLRPEAEGGLGPSLLLLWESQGTLWSFLAGVLGVPTFGWDWGRGKEEGGPTGD